MSKERKILTVARATTEMERRRDIDWSAAFLRIGCALASLGLVVGLIWAALSWAPWKR